MRISRFEKSSHNIIAKKKNPVKTQHTDTREVKQVEWVTRTHVSQHPRKRLEVQIVTNVPIVGTVAVMLGIVDTIKSEAIIRTQGIGTHLLQDQTTNACQKSPIKINWYTRNEFNTNSKTVSTA